MATQPRNPVPLPLPLPLGLSSQTEESLKYKNKNPNPQPPQPPQPRIIVIAELFSAGYKRRVWKVRRRRRSCVAVVWKLCGRHLFELSLCVRALSGVVVSSVVAVTPLPPRRREKRAMSSVSEKSQFWYDYGSGMSGFSDLPSPLPYRVRVSQFSENQDAGELQRRYTKQVEWSIFDGNIFLRMHYLDVSRKRIISEYYESDLEGWLETKNSLKYQSGTDWWDNIKEDFISIFRPVFKGLKMLHLKGQFHGNLSLNDGIKVQTCNGQRRGVLTDMAVLPVQGKIDEQLSSDVNTLQNIIRKVLDFPFEGGIVMIKEVQDLCLSQLKYYSRNSHLTIKWSLDPVLFWDVNRRRRFLLAVYWAFYRQGSSSSPPEPDKEILASSMFQSWHYNPGQATLYTVYNHELDPEKWATDYSILKFYRNCIKHAKYPNNDEIRKNWVLCPENIHELFMEHAEGLNVLNMSILTTSQIFQIQPVASRRDKIESIWRSLANQIGL